MILEPIFEAGFEDSSYGYRPERSAKDPIPLLANVYLHLIDKIVNSASSLFGKLGIDIVRYADDFVLMGKTLPTEIVGKLKNLLSRMGLKNLLNIGLTLLLICCLYLQHAQFSFLYLGVSAMISA